MALIAYMTGLGWEMDNIDSRLIGFELLRVVHRLPNSGQFSMLSKHNRRVTFLFAAVTDLRE